LFSPLCSVFSSAENGRRRTESSKKKEQIFGMDGISISVLVILQEIHELKRRFSKTDFTIEGKTPFRI
jgi:hypothetical protein